MPALEELASDTVWCNACQDCQWKPSLDSITGLSATDHSLGPANTWRRTIMAARRALASVSLSLSQDEDARRNALAQIQRLGSLCEFAVQFSSVFDKWLQRVGDVEATLASTRNKMDELCNVVAQLAAKVDAGTAMPTDRKALQEAVIARRAGCATCVAELKAVLAKADNAAGVDSWCAQHPGAGSANAVCEAARDFLSKVSNVSLALMATSGCVCMCDALPFLSVATPGKRRECSATTAYGGSEQWLTMCTSSLHHERAPTLTAAVCGDVANHRCTASRSQHGTWLR